MVRSRWCRRRFDVLPSQRRRRLRDCDSRQPERGVAEPWHEVVLAYVLAAARAEDRGDVELARELESCAIAMMDRAAK